jgi:hypothetical protein
MRPGQRGHRFVPCGECRVLALLGRAAGARAREPGFRGVPRRVNQTEALRDAGREATGDAVGFGTRQRPRYERPDHEMTWAFPGLFAKITRPELRAGFKEGTEGFATIDFRLYGTTLEPKTDLLSRVGKAAATGVAKDQVNKLLKTKIF